MSKFSPKEPLACRLWVWLFSTFQQLFFSSLMSTRPKGNSHQQHMMFDACDYMAISFHPVSQQWWSSTLRWNIWCNYMHSCNPGQVPFSGKPIPGTSRRNLVSLTRTLICMDGHIWATVPWQLLLLTMLSWVNVDLMMALDWEWEDRKSYFSS